MQYLSIIFILICFQSLSGSSFTQYSFVGKILSQIQNLDHLFIYLFINAEQYLQSIFAVFILDLWF